MSSIATLSFTRVTEVSRVQPRENIHKASYHTLILKTARMCAEIYMNGGNFLGSLDKSINRIVTIGRFDRDQVTKDLEEAIGLRIPQDSYYGLLELATDECAKITERCVLIAKSTQWVKRLCNLNRFSIFEIGIDLESAIETAKFLKFSYGRLIENAAKETLKALDLVDGTVWPQWEGSIDSIEKSTGLDRRKIQKDFIRTVRLLLPQDGYVKFLRNASVGNILEGTLLRKRVEKIEDLTGKSSLTIYSDFEVLVSDKYKILQKVQLVFKCYHQRKDCLAAVANQRLQEASDFLIQNGTTLELLKELPSNPLDIANTFGLAQIGNMMLLAGILGQYKQNLLANNRWLLKIETQRAETCLIWNRKLRSCFPEEARDLEQQETQIRSKLRDVIRDYQQTKEAVNQIPGDLENKLRLLKKSKSLVPASCCAEVFSYHPPSDRDE